MDPGGFGGAGDDAADNFSGPPLMGEGSRLCRVGTACFGADPADGVGLNCPEISGAPHSGAAPL